MRKHGYMNYICGHCCGWVRADFSFTASAAGHGVERQYNIPQRGSRNNGEASKIRNLKSVLGWLANPWIGEAKQHNFALQHSTLTSSKGVTH